MCFRFFVPLPNFTRFRRVPPWCDGNCRKEGKDGDNSKRPTLITVDYFLGNIASIHILPRYVQMHSLSFRPRQTEIPSFPKLWAGRETPKNSKRDNSSLTGKSGLRKTVGHGRAWVGGEYLNPRRARSESLTALSSLPLVWNILLGTLFCGFLYPKQ